MRESAEMPTADDLDLLLVAAVAAELRPFAEGLGLRLPVTGSAVMRHGGRPVGLLAAGVGRQGDPAVARALEETAPRCAVNVGVGGALHAGLSPGAVVLVAGWCDSSTGGIVARPHAALTARLAEVLDGAGVAWTEALAVTVAEPLQDLELRDRIQRHSGAHVVEMEGAAWAGIADDAGVPFAAIRSVSDHADAPLVDRGPARVDRDRLFHPDGSPRTAARDDGRRDTAETSPRPGGAASERVNLADGVTGDRLDEAGKAWAAAMAALGGVADAILGDLPLLP